MAILFKVILRNRPISAAFYDAHEDTENLFSSLTPRVPRGITWFLCRLRSIATHRDHFVRRLSVRLSVRPSVTLPELCFAGDTCIPRIAATILMSLLLDAKFTV